MPIWEIRGKRHRRHHFGQICEAFIFCVFLLPGGAYWRMSMLAGGISKDQVCSCAPQLVVKRHIAMNSNGRGLCQKRRR